MNAVEIEAAVSDLASEPFDPEEFPFAFLHAFGNKETTVKRLRKGEKNTSDVPGGVLQRNNIHIAVCKPREIAATLKALRESPRTTAAKAKFILATDGVTLEAEDLASGETIASEYPDFAAHFGFFLPLAGISTIREIKDNPIDIRATGRLNKLYTELLRNNPEWGSEARRHDMNHFMARLIFCFFAEDTDIFDGEGLFTSTVEQMSQSDGADTHHVVSEIFRAMNTKKADRAAANLPSWADQFRYVNGGLFFGSTDVPRFTRIGRSYLLRAGELSWRQINPDIFGSMIQAVAEEEERGALGLHYTSVPNILKVLNPLFLDDLRAQLETAGDNARALLNLRKRMSRIRVFDPACGSGNFLVIAYKQMREIEAEINRRRGETGVRTEIPKTNFRGIELRDFPTEIARLALIIAEYQSDVAYRGQKAALVEFLPLDSMNWITCGNALRLDWLSVCPPTANTVKFTADDLFSTPLNQAQIDFENEGGETYICGNPPYKGSQTQTKEQKADLAHVFEPYGISSAQIDYVGGWFMKAAEYAQRTETDAAFVSTNSICQGRVVPILWPRILEIGSIIHFAYTSFKWSNLASNNAGVTVAIVGMSRSKARRRYLFVDTDRDGNATIREASNITPYLTLGETVIVTSRGRSIAALSEMSFGNMPIDGGNLLLAPAELADLQLEADQRFAFIRRIYGSAEFIRGIVRHCLWISDEQLSSAEAVDSIRIRIDKCHAMRVKSRDDGTKDMAIRAHQFREMNESKTQTLVLAGVSSEGREYLPVGLLDNRSIVSNLAFALYDAPLWNMALIASRLHLVWIATVCGKLKTDFRYSNTLGWNTFPVPPLSDQNKAELTRCAERILLTRESHFPATIADLYDPEQMPEDLRSAHSENDETLERIYIGRRFRNDTERLEKLFDLYTKMTSAESKPVSTGKRAARAK